VTASAPVSPHRGPRGFDGIRGQDVAIGTLTRALESRRVHHAYRFEGPEGVGKEAAARRFARALVCTGGDPLGCGACGACERALRMTPGPPELPAHPDVVLVERGLYPAAAFGKSSPETAEISVAQVRSLIIAKAAFPPHEGRARVYLVRAAHELSVSAANALLKTLEEPIDRTHFVLLTSRPDRLLPTIRSRTLPVRFGPLPDSLLADVLAERGVPTDLHPAVIALASGSASAALALSDPTEHSVRDGFVRAILGATDREGPNAAMELAEHFDKGREELRELLRGLALHLVREARALAEHDPDGAAEQARRYESIGAALRRSERNAAGGLTLAELVLELRGARVLPPPRF